MGKIQILPEELSNRIAAGEVVERPASVVKELFENAVDAGASAVTIEIERAGSRLVRVTDNGCGMEENDALLAFSPHATSKIKNAADIERILTLGFRGEALPSIAAVSRLSLRTRTAASPAGVEILIEGGKIVGERPAGLAVGSAVSVRDLFFNVPARKKFLRSAATEEAHIQETVLALALGFPTVSVTLKFDGRCVLQASGAGDALTRAAELFGKAFASRLMEVDYADKAVAVKGLIAVPGFTRPSRREQRTFINGRAVESQTLYRGIRDGYGTLADFGRFPPVILNLEMDAGEYDINVHPTKREVRFKQDFTVLHAVSAAIQAALHGAPAPEMNLPADRKLAAPESLLDTAEISYELPPEQAVIPGLNIESPKVELLRRKELTPPVPAASPEETAPVKLPQEPPPEPCKPAAVPNAPAASAPAVSAETKLTDCNHISVPPAAVRSPLAAELSEPEKLHYLGIALGTFVLVESEVSDSVLLIDFHAAHERVLFEGLLARAKQQESTPSQALLLAVTVELSRTAAAFLGKNEKLFTALGFDLSLLSSNTVMISAVPASLPADADYERILTDAVSAALEGESSVQSSLEKIARAACHAAVKANDPLNETSAKALLTALSGCERPDVCPHGRPTVLRLSRGELCRRFGRI